MGPRDALPREPLSNSQRNHRTADDDDDYLISKAQLRPAGTAACTAPTIQLISIMHSPQIAQPSSLCKLQEKLRHPRNRNERVIYSFMLIGSTLGNYVFFVSIFVFK
jgi:hypothetical protein